MMEFLMRASAILYNHLTTEGGDGVYLLPANVCPIVPITFLKARRRFEFVDISGETCCMDHDIVMERLRKCRVRYAGLLYVRSYGVLEDVDPFFRRLKQMDGSLTIIDDRCLCPPSFQPSYDPSIDIVLYSTGYAKYVDVGMGGFAYLADGVAYERHDTPYDPAAFSELEKGYKAVIAARIRYRYRNSDWLDTSVPKLPFDRYRHMVETHKRRVRAHKERLNDIYSAHLPDGIKMRAGYDGWRCNVLVPDKEGLLKSIFDHGLFASSHYASLEGVFSGGRAPAAEKLHQNVVNLFNDRYFDAEKAFEVTRIVNEHLQRIEEVS